MNPGTYTFFSSFDFLLLLLVQYSPYRYVQRLAGPDSPRKHIYSGVLTTTGVIYSLLVSDIALLFTTTQYVYIRMYARVAGELLTRSSSRAFTAPFPLGPCELWRCLHIGASKTTLYLYAGAHVCVGSSFETSNTICAIANGDVLSGYEVFSNFIIAILTF